MNQGSICAGIVAKNMPEIDRLVAQKRGRIAGLQVAMVAMNAKNGDILAMVGGRPDPDGEAIT